ncbi:hypothetical protein IMY05_018G0027100 [Salix suchowensis]|nr:hypothetical protein IMY05_018G0027100 [Salix suchowensis]
MHVLLLATMSLTANLIQYPSFWCAGIPSGVLLYCGTVRIGVEYSVGCWCAGIVSVGLFLGPSRNAGRGTTIGYDSLKKQTEAFIEG